MKKEQSTINNQQPPVVILADGEFPNHAEPLGVLEAAGTIVCCDGAAEKLLRYGKVPDFIVGDLDSLSDGIKARFADRLFHFATQDTNDLTKAVDFCLQRGATRLTILGATGLREDHAIANIALLADYTKKCDVEMITNYGRFAAITQTTTFESYAGQQVSVFSMTPDTPVTLHNLKYPLVNQKLSMWWMGTLNEATGAEFTVEFEHGALLVFQKHHSVC